jgi:methylthioribose-1-phosphate isomerase
VPRHRRLRRRVARAGQGVLTHCNAGGLATADYGTALAVIFAAHEQGKSVHVFADETRPLLQGARLTAWELQRRGVPVTLICDSMAAQVMKEGKVQTVVVGADRIAANGDTANKIGTYGVALLARAHGLAVLRGGPVQHLRPLLARRLVHPDRAARPRRGHARSRPPDRPRGRRRLQPGLRRDPRLLITGIITERGVIRPVDRDTIRATLEASPVLGPLEIPAGLR